MADNMSMQIAEGNRNSLNTAKSLISTPMLINPGAGYYPGQDIASFVIPLQTEGHSQDIEIEVSDSLVICADQKKNVNDNIAPGAYTWSLNGFIPGMSPVNFIDPMLKVRTDLLKMAASKGYMLIYKDIDNTLYKRVVITSLRIETQKDCKNATPFSMTLKQINVMSDEESSESGSVIAAMAEAGSNMGNALSAGATIAVNTVGSLVEAL